MGREEGYNISDTGNWNVASDYAKIKIMKPLALSDEYSNIAIFGTSTLLEELQTTIPVEILQLRGLRRLIHCLITLIDNTQFAIKGQTDREDMTKHKEKLKKILAIIPVLSKVTINQRKRTSSLKLKEEVYSKVLDEVLEIKSKINEPLNKNHLIFTDKEEFDPSAYKKTIKEGAVSRG